jgi:hypothetical protein
VQLPQINHALRAVVSVHNFQADRWPLQLDAERLLHLHDQRGQVGR